MYPRLSDLINDLLGTHINLPIQSYGFFVAIAFLAAGYFFYLELKRKEKQGLLAAQTKKILKGRPASVSEITLSFFIGFIVGFKLVDMILNYSDFANHPQEFLFSIQGNWWGGLIIGVSSAFYTYWKKQKSKLDQPVYEDITLHPYQLTTSIILVAALSGLIGAKIFHQLENWDDFIADPIGSLFSFSGLTFYGGLIVATFAVIYYAKRNKINWIHLADSISPSLILGYGLGRIGCQVSGDGDWGIVNTSTKPHWLNWLPDGLWAYDYPHNVLQQGIPIDGCVGEYCYKLAEPVYPTPVYETISCIIIFFILWYLRKRLSIPGVLFSIYLIFNGMERFFIEKIRVNTTYQLMGYQITQAEIIATVLIILGILGIFYFKRRQVILSIKT